MMKKRRLHPSASFVFAALSAWIVLSWGAIAHARELHLSYEANWGGLHVADFSLSLINGGNVYENRFHLETRGATRFFTNLAVTASSRGRIISPPATTNGDNGGNGGATIGNAAGAHLADTYLAKTYHTEYTNSRHFRWVDIDFGEGDEPAHASTGTSPIPGREERWNPAEKGPEVLEKVEENYRIGVSDPITMIPQMMTMVRAHLNGGPPSTVVKGFDGRRRFDMDVTYLGLASRTVKGILHDTYHVRVTPNPVAGFKERHKILWNGSTYDFYLSRDDRFVPIQIVPVKHGPVLTLITECETQCPIKAEEE
ncbi:MAG: DUF3108 domain-containing protein [Rhodospirillales bacterium]|nr:DUF3108 domain-containing protein [Rhodospirillales bacterium]